MRFAEALTQNTALKRNIDRYNSQEMSTKCKSLYQWKNTKKNETGEIERERVCVCVCEREREIERGRGREGGREGEGGRESKQSSGDIFPFIGSN